MDPHRPKVGLGDDRVGMAKRYFDGEVRSLREKLSEKDISLAKASRIQKVLKCLISCWNVSFITLHQSPWNFQPVCVCTGVRLCACVSVCVRARSHVWDWYIYRHAYVHAVNMHKDILFYSDWFMWSWCVFTDPAFSPSFFRISICMSCLYHMYVSNCVYVCVYVCKCFLYISACIFGVSIVYIIAILLAICAIYYLLVHTKYESCWAERSSELNAKYTRTTNSSDVHTKCE